jgi:hypothetical protein
MIENWKPVIGYQNLYEVSDLGNVRSLDRFVPKEKKPRKGKLLKPRNDVKGAGYRYVNLSKNGIPKKINVHILVLEAFVGPRPFAQAHARHLDGDRTNPALMNLVWGTPSENAQDKVLHGTDARGEKNKKSILTQEFVNWIKESKQSSIFLSSIFEVAGSTIRAVRIGQNWSYKNVS